jgi:hypothetical protein
MQKIINSRAIIFKMISSFNNISKSKRKNYKPNYGKNRRIGKRTRIERLGK